MERWYDMVLNNFLALWNHLWHSATSTTSSSSITSFTHLYGDIVDVNGNSDLMVNDILYTGSYNYLQWSLNTSKNKTPFAELSMIIGTGTTEPIIMDYTLESPFTGSNVNSSIQFLIDQGKIKMKGIYTCTNNTEENVIISEAGICKIVHSYNSDRSAQLDSKCLLVRTLLDNPVTIPAGQTATITLDWDLY